MFRSIVREWVCFAQFPLKKCLYLLFVFGLVAAATIFSGDVQPAYASSVMTAVQAPSQQDPAPEATAGELLTNYFQVNLQLQSVTDSGLATTIGDVDTNAGPDNTYVFDWTSFVPNRPGDTVDWIEGDWIGNYRYGDPTGDHVTVDHDPAPGTADLDYYPSGGEEYDVEAFYFDNDADYFYIAIVTSVPFSGTYTNQVSGSVFDALGVPDIKFVGSTTGSIFYPGDLALDLGVGTPRDEQGDNAFRYDYGVDLVHEDRTTQVPYNEAGWIAADERDFSLGDQLYKTQYDAGGSDNSPDPGSAWYTSVFKGFTTGGWSHTNFDPIGTPGLVESRGAVQTAYYEYTFPGGILENDSPTYVIEFVIPRTLFQDDNPGNGSPIGIRWVEGCRNDGNGIDGVLTLNGTIDEPPTPETVSLGDQIWFDANNNGVKDSSEVGIADVTATLWTDDNGDGAPDTNTTLTSTTNAEGYYIFDDLVPGDYVVQIAPDQFEPASPLFGLLSSNGNDIGATGSPDPDTGDVDNDDNGDPVAGLGVLSKAVTLTVGGEPTDDDESGIASNVATESSNRTVDFGFYEPVALGDQVWLDVDNNGVKDVDEVGIQGVTLNLWIDADDDGIPETDTGLSATTGTNGYYLFDGIPPGDYFIQIPSTNFAPNAPLDGLSSSTGNGIAPDVDDSPIEDDDNGDPAVNLGNLDGVVTQAITLVSRGEPIDDNEAGIASTAPNNSSNKTVDFGFYQEGPGPMSLGDQVWLDINDNGQIDGSEPGISGVLLKLWSDDDGDGGPDTDLAITATTNISGFYLFDNLTPGDYVVQIPASEFATGKPLEGHSSSTGNDSGTGAPDPDNDQNNDDNGIPMGGGIVSLAVTLTADGEPTDDGGLTSGTATNENSNLTVDFGFFQIGGQPELSLGDQIWLDSDNSGLIDNGETGIAGVQVKLWRDTNGDNAPDEDLNLTATTNISGFYLFDNLVPGDYIVQVPASEFGTGKPLEGLSSSTGNDVGTTGAPDPDNNQNNDDNGDPDGTGGITSKAVTLATGNEPINDTGPTSGNARDEDSNLTIDFGFFRSGAEPTQHSLGNYIWLDGDNNGQVDANESPVADGVLVELLSSQGVVLQSATTVNGFYLFTNLIPGRYQVRLAASNFQTSGLLVGYSHSTGVNQEATPDNDGDQNDNGLDGSSPPTDGITSAPVTIGTNEPTSETPTATGTPGDDGNGTPDANSNLTVDFGVVRAAHSLGNYVWSDTNNNGIVDPNEGPVPDGVFIELLDEQGRPLNNTTTANGFYIFGSLTEGNYRVRLAASNFAPGGRLANYTHSSGDGQEDDPNAGGDQNDNGLDTSDPVASGITSGLVILNSDEPTLETPTATGTSGDDGLGTEDSSSNLTVDFGVVPPATTVAIGNMVWHDEDNDGQYNPLTESGIAGLQLQLFMTGSDPSNSDPLMTQSTAADGSYHFSGLTPGSYFIYIPSPPTGLPMSSSRTDGVDNQEDNDNNGIQILPGGPVRSPDIELTINGEPTNDGDGSSSDQTIDFGFWKPMYSLGNYLWIDSDDNGVVDTGESYVPDGVLVELLNGDGSPTGMVTETVNGFYLFNELDPGDYRVRIAASNFMADGLLEGYTHSTGAGQEEDPNNNDDQNDNGLDSSVVTIDGISSGIVSLGSDEPLNESPTLSTLPGNDGAGTLDGNSNLTVDFGVVPPSSVLMSLGNLVWNDANSNGIVDPNEPGIDGVTVQLFQAGDDPTSASPVRTEQTSGGGFYQFTDLEPGIYFVYIPTPLAPFTGSSPIESEADDQRDNDDNGIQSTINGAVRSPDITLTPNNEPTNDGDGANSDLTIDFGFFNTPVAVGDRVWFDENGNGLLDSGEQGVPNVTVWLYQDGVPITESPFLTTTTFDNGFYLFPAVPSGEYYVRFDLSSLPIGYIPTLQDVGTDDGIDSDADPDTGVTPSTGTLVPETSNLTLDLGITREASVGDLVWYDTDADGTQDGDETGQPAQIEQIGVPGVSVTLFTADNDQVGVTTTNADGSYHFDGLLPGGYYLRFTPPAGFSVSPTDAGTDDLFDSDVQADSLQTAPFSLTAGQHDPTRDLGLYLPSERPATLGNRVWLDSNRDGIQNQDEPGLPSILVTLRDSTNNALSETRTDENGNYLFRNLAPGTYRLGFTAPEGYLFSPQDVGSNPAEDSDADLITGITSPITLESGEDDRNWDAGFYIEEQNTGAIGDRVWLDANGNGLQDEEMSQAGVSGITVMLYGEENQLVATTTTDATGTYRFERLLGGNYYLVFDLPSSYAPTDDEVGTDESEDSDVDSTTWRTPIINITSGENDTDWDLGLIVPNVTGEATAIIGGEVWEESRGTNGRVDGLRDDTEMALSSIVVKLYDNLGDLMATTFTDQTGAYTFTNVLTGTYYLEFVSPSSPSSSQVYSFTTSSEVSGVDNDSDANSQTGRTMPIRVVSGSEDFTWDVGFFTFDPTNLPRGDEPGIRSEIFLPLIDSR
ncbi:MAG: SdrD B-like domain-containing protein [Chloroflexota bacterium]